MRHPIREHHYENEPIWTRHAGEKCVQRGGIARRRRGRRKKKEKEEEEEDVEGR